jgi:hypothetical protein
MYALGEIHRISEDGEEAWITNFSGAASPLMVWVTVLLIIVLVFPES